MPTISEPTWQEREERRKQAIKEYIEAKHLEINDSIDVLGARLFALGMRGTDLAMYIMFAQCEKKNYRAQQVPPGGRALDASVVWLRDRKKLS
jgi:hypothetical protein